MVEFNLFSLLLGFPKCEKVVFVCNWGIVDAVTAIFYFLAKVTLGFIETSLQRIQECQVLIICTVINLFKNGLLVQGDRLFIQLWCILAILHTWIWNHIILLITLLMHAQTKTPPNNLLEQDNPEVCHSLRFSFIERLLSDTRASLIPPHLTLQPLASRNSHRSQPPDSAKNILKKAIIQQNQFRPINHHRDSFLMKGRMLNGVKKPLESQMASLLQGINDRINKEIERNDKVEKKEKKQKSTKVFDLPMLSKGQKIQMEPKEQYNLGSSRQETKFKCKQIFKKLKEARNARKTIDEGFNFISKPPKNNQFTPVPTSKATNSSISREPLSTLTASQKRCAPADQSPRKVLVLKKGYYGYDEENRKFLDQNRNNMSLPFEQVPQKTKHLTAHSFLVIDSTTLTPVAGRNIHTSIEIASISKVMTCYLALLCCRKYNIDMYSYQARVTDKAADMPGTTAQLQSGDVLTIFELMLGLMLPSGNDASVALAEAIGKVIQRHKQKETKRTYFQTFLAHMNLLSKEMNLNQSWSNSSGLSFNPNYSTPQSIALLTAVAIRDPVFSKIVNAKKHEIQIKNERYGLSRKLVWKNTNKLLESGWQGVKTGTTETAGHCLMARKGSLLISVYHCQTLSKRFSECAHLYEKYSHFDHF